MFEKELWEEQNAIQLTKTKRHAASTLSSYTRHMMMILIRKYATATFNGKGPVMWTINDQHQQNTLSSYQSKVRKGFRAGFIADLTDRTPFWIQKMKRLCYSETWILSVKVTAVMWEWINKNPSSEKSLMLSDCCFMDRSKKDIGPRPTTSK